MNVIIMTNPQESMIIDNTSMKTLKMSVDLICIVVGHLWSINSANFHVAQAIPRQKITINIDIHHIILIFFYQVMISDKHWCQLIYDRKHMFI